MSSSCSPRLPFHLSFPTKLVCFACLHSFCQEQSLMGVPQVWRVTHSVAEATVKGSLDGSATDIVFAEEEI